MIVLLSHWLMTVGLVGLLFLLLEHLEIRQLRSRDPAKLLALRVIGRIADPGSTASLGNVRPLDQLQFNQMKNP